uniref:Uncharacterized protein n=1 Tax=Arundo donax TaxID=35708 RepID=A0A0A9FS86_ARUDO
MLHICIMLPSKNTFFYRHRLVSYQLKEALISK